MFARRPRPHVFIIAEDPNAQSAASRGVTEGALDPHRARRLERARARIGMCAVLFGCVFAGLAARLTTLSLEAPDPAALRVAAAPRHAERAEILDRNGAILATNLPTRALDVAGREVWDAAETARELSAVLPRIDERKLAAALGAGRYVEAARDLTPEERDAVFALGLPGVHFRDRLKRYFPHRDVAAHVVGHVSPGFGGTPEGVMGLERRLDAEKRRAGRPLVSSIDLQAQQAVEAELARAVDKNHAKAGWAVILKVATGEVIASASYPDFDPNAPGAVPADARRNRVTYDTYEMGSAFKAVTAAAALDAGVSDETTIYDARKPLRVADRQIRDYRGKRKLMTLGDVLRYSSNIGIAQVAADLGVDRQRAALGALGLFDPLAIELAETQSPRGPRKWGPVEAATISYGHGFSVTPLHLAAAFAAVVGDGTYRAPTYLRVDGAVEGAPVFSDKTAIVMRRLLRGVVTDGTATKAEAAGYFPIGKTSTADKPFAGGYDRSRRLASFIGAFPGHAPDYVALVSLDEPTPVEGTFGFATAGWNAAPAFSRMVSRVAPLLSVMPVSEGEAYAAFAFPSLGARRAAVETPEPRRKPPGRTPRASADAAPTLQ
ncbi:MAG: penicillin-binding protein 2 [Pseudomonadota bacterium]